MTENRPDTTLKPAPELDLTRFPIRILSEKTTVGTSTLRAWERRYGLLHPERTPKGHRLYSEKDIKRVIKIMDLLNDGHSLPRISEMLSIKDQDHEIEMGGIDSSEAENSEQSNNSLSNIWAGLIKSTLEATADFNIERIDSIYNEASSLYPVDMVTDRLIQPTIKILGDAWQTRPESGIAEEHFYTSWLKNRLGARFHHAYNHAKGARIICACLPGTYHEIGLMLFSLSALARGYRVLYFGADLPLNQVAYIAQRSAAKAIVFGSQPQIDSEINSELPELIKQLDTPVFIGGPDKLIDTDTFEQAGGIMLGSNISVALKVFESHIPTYSAARHPG